MKTGIYKLDCKSFEAKYKDINKTGHEMLDKANEFVQILGNGFSAGTQYNRVYYHELLFCYMEVMNQPVNKSHKGLLNIFEDRMVEAIDNYCYVRDIEYGIEQEEE